MCFLVYGNYPHDPGEVELSISQSEVTSEAGYAVGYVERWDVTGEIITDDHSVMAARIAALRAAYSVQGRDATFYAPDGVTVLHRLRSVNTVAGVKVIPPSFPYEANRGLYATAIKYALTITGEFTTVLKSSLVAWQETLTFSGGGPRYVFRQPLRGKPIKQQVAESTVYRLNQSGRAVGRYAYPTAPPPLYPEHLVENAPASPTGPEFKDDGQLLNWSIAWNYVMESVDPLEGMPTLPR